MGLFDAFTGDPANAAAEASRNYLGTAQNNLVTATGLTRDQIEQILRAAYAEAGGDLGTGYDAASGAVRAATGNAFGYLDDGASGAEQSLRRARDDLTANGG